MRRRIWIATLSGLLATSLLHAHGGGLDSNGGHYNRKTGVYHCHRCPCGCETTKKAPTSSTPRPSTPSGAKAQQAGDPDVKVWVNTSSGVYHCAGTKWYGTTKQGRYMTQKEAREDGHRPAYGNACR